MVSNQVLSPILGDEGITRGLADPEARILIEWLVMHAEGLDQRLSSQEQMSAAVRQMCRRAKSICRFVVLWNNPRSRGAACQLAAVERFPWPLPTMAVDPCDLMLDILAYEEPESWI